MHRITPDVMEARIAERFHRAGIDPFPPSFEHHYSAARGTQAYSIAVPAGKKVGIKRVDGPYRATRSAAFEAAIEAWLEANP